MAGHSADSSNLDFNREDYSDSSPEDVANKHSQIIESFAHLYEALLAGETIFDANARQAFEDSKTTIKSVLDQFGETVSVANKLPTKRTIVARCDIALLVYDQEKKNIGSKYLLRIEAAKNAIEHIRNLLQVRHRKKEKNLFKIIMARKASEEKYLRLSSNLNQCEVPSSKSTELEEKKKTKP